MQGTGGAATETESMASSRPHPSNPRSARVLIAGLMAAGGLSGCIGALGSVDKSSANTCTPGERDCVCGPAQSCQPGLMCIAERCIATNTTSSPRTPGVNSTAPITTATSSSTDGPLTTGSSTATSQGTSSSTSPKSIEKKACSDGQTNYRETDVDCGGPVCSGCAEQKSCRGDVDCAQGVCVNLICMQCETDTHCEDENPCTKNTCLDNRCVFDPVEEGSACNDQDPCTAGDQCNAGSCTGKDTRVLSDSFDKGGKGWRFTHHQGNGYSLWEIGVAKASDCGDKSLGQDPGQDHSNNGFNGVAGLKIGACQEKEGDNQWDCLWSKDVDISFFEEPVEFSFWRHLHSPAMGQAGVTSRIVYRVNGSGQSNSIATGYENAVNDLDWTFQSYSVDPQGAESIAFGVCYSKGPGAKAFAGWSLDDARIRQKGCEPNQ